MNGKGSVVAKVLGSSYCSFCICHEKEAWMSDDEELCWSNLNKAREKERDLYWSGFHLKADIMHRDYNEWEGKRTLFQHKEWSLSFSVTFILFFFFFFSFEDLCSLRFWRRRQEERPNYCQAAWESRALLVLQLTPFTFFLVSPSSSVSLIRFSNESCERNELQSFIIIITRYSLLPYFVFLTIEPLTTLLPSFPPFFVLSCTILIQSFEHNLQTRNDENEWKTKWKGCQKNRE
jgi:hypothetical protein